MKNYARYSYHLQISSCRYKLQYATVTNPTGHWVMIFHQDSRGDPMSQHISHCKSQTLRGPND